MFDYARYYDDMINAYYYLRNNRTFMELIDHLNTVYTPDENNPYQFPDAETFKYILGQKTTLEITENDFNRITIAICWYGHEKQFIGVRGIRKPFVVGMETYIDGDFYRVHLNKNVTTGFEGIVKYDYSVGVKFFYISCKTVRIFDTVIKSQKFLKQMTQKYIL